MYECHCACISLYCPHHRTLSGHNGTVWAMQVNNGMLISGAHDKTVHALLTYLHQDFYQHACCQLHVRRVCSLHS